MIRTMPRIKACKGLLMYSCIWTYCIRKAYSHKRASVFVGLILILLINLTNIEGHDLTWNPQGEVREGGMTLRQVNHFQVN